MARSLLVFLQLQKTWLLAGDLAPVTGQQRQCDLGVANSTYTLGAAGYCLHWG